MIAVTFNGGVLAGQTVNYAVRCKDLGFMSWHHMDYKPMFEPIAKIINADVNHIEKWRVI